MRPPECWVCGRGFEPSRDGGDLVEFRSRPEDRHLLEEHGGGERVGHPPNAEWFCARHLVGAQRLRELTLPDARARLLVDRDS